MDNPINYWYQKYIAIKAKMDEMMNGAVEGEIQVTLSGRLVPAITHSLDESMFNLGDKVKLIIIKEEEK